MWGSEDTWVIPASPAHHRWAPKANHSPSGRAGPSPVSPFPAQACGQRKVKSDTGTLAGWASIHCGDKE